LILSMILIIICTCVYWLLWPYNIIDVHSLTIQNPGKAVRQGETLFFAIEFEKFSDVEGVVTKQIVNDVYRLPYFTETGGMSVAGPRRTNIVPLPIPDFFPVGAGYRLKWSVKYPCNPIRWVTETITSDEFVITAKDSEPGEKGEPGIPGKQGEQGEQGERGKKGQGFWPGAQGDDTQRNQKRSG